MSESSGEFLDPEQSDVVPLIPSIEAAGAEISNYISDNGITHETGFTEEQKVFIQEWLRAYIDCCPYLNTDFLVESNQLLFLPTDEIIPVILQFQYALARGNLGVN